MTDIEDTASEAERSFIEAEAFAFAAAMLRSIGDAERLDRALDELNERIPDNDLASTVYLTAVETLVIEALPHLLPHMATKRREQARIERVADFIEQRAAENGWEPAP